MSFLVKVHKDNLIKELPYILLDKRNALAIDSFCTIATGLEDLTGQIETTLLNYSKFVFINEGNSKDFNFRVVANQVWWVIDSVRRIFQLLPHIGYKPDQPEYLRVMDEIIGIRNSFQHFDERIDEYFVNNGDSVLGEFIWRYKAIEGGKELGSVLWHTGPSLGSSTANNKVFNMPDEKFNSCVGVYDLNIVYIKRNKQKLVVSIDEAVGFVNFLLKEVHNYHLRKILVFMKENNLTELSKIGLPPMGLVMHA